MSDFDPNIRNAALWSGDSRRIAAGDACGVVLEKLGRTEPEDISGAEEVQMGKRLQPIVARIFEDVHDVRLKDMTDDAGTHPAYPWLRSHFDYVKDDYSYLVECKNYNDNYAKFFSDEGEEIRIPAADRAQCLHEAIVYGVEFVWLAVLFGGQRYRDYRLYFSTEEKEAWIKRLAEVWGNVQTNTIPPPSTPDQAREVWPQDDGNTIVANKKIEHLCVLIADWKKARKTLDDNIDAAQAAVMDFMGSRASLVGIDGKVLATWKTSKSTHGFSAEMFKSAMPEMYDRFCVEKMGARRFLVKG